MIDKPDDPLVSLHDLQVLIKEFASARDWLKFHNPRNVAEAIVVESAELLECFLWQRDDACLATNLNEENRKAVISELADVLIYALNLANALDVSAFEIIRAKLDANALRFPPASG